MPYKDPERERASARKRVAKYQATEKGRAAKAKYSHSEKAKAKKARYRNSDKGRDTETAYRNSDEGKDTLQRAVAKYQKTQKGKANQLNNNRLRRARLAGVVGATFTAADWSEVKARHHYRCFYCKRKPKRLEMDHVIPLSQGGRHSKENIVSACRTCNAKKYNKIILLL